MTTGILLTNTGTPCAPTTKAVRRYLREFLSDPRIIQLPKFIWLPILYSVVLTLRPSRSAKLYQKIWQPDGAPMRTYMNRIAEKLRVQLDLPVEVGMHYGKPSIPHAIDQLHQQNVTKIITLPLFPQYSNTTSASSFDRVTQALRQTTPTPSMHFISSYAKTHEYIEALAQRIEQFWQQQGKGEHLIVSFHGVPKRYTKRGDPYAEECRATASLLAKRLQLQDTAWTLAYQSKFGYDEWLTPSITSVLEHFPRQGVKTVDVICPGFSVDCLETLEEIKIRGSESFLESGGEELRYIPALNDSTLNISLITALLKPSL